MSITCPDADTMRALRQGRLDEERAALLEAHLESCSACQGELHQLAPPDSLLADLCAIANENATDNETPGPDLRAQLKALAASSPPAATTAEGLAEQTTVSPLGQVGGYHLLEVLGEGGMGTVYRAEDVVLGRRVALKTMKASLAHSSLHRQRFLREARATAALHHENVVSIFEVGQDQDLPFLVMPLLEGMALDRWLASGNRPTIPQSLRLGCEVARGLAAAHAVGLVHRDVKPANLWLEAPDGRIKVLDFGLARQTQEELHLTQTGAILGTPAYMAPEQAEGATLDPRSDLFSLGCVLYQLVVGKPPFKGSTPAATLKAVALHHPPPPRQVSSSVPQGLSDLVMRLLAKKVAERPASAREVVEALQALREACPGDDQVRPMPAREEPPRTGRGRLLGMRVSLAGMLLVLVAGVCWWLWPHAERIRSSESGTEAMAPEEPDRAILASPLAAPPGKEKHEDPSLLEGPGDVAALPTPTLKGHAHFVYSAAFSPDGKRIVTASWDGTAKVWDAQSGAEILTLKGHAEFVLEGKGFVWSAAFSPDGKRIVTASADRTAKVWDARSGTVILTLKKHRGFVYSAAFSPDGKRIVTASADRTAKVWDARSGAEILTLKGHAGLLRSAAFSPDGKRIVTVSDDFTAKVWDARSGDEIFSFEEHGRNITWSARFSPDGARIVTASSDATAKVWDTRSGTETRSLRGHGGIVFSAAYSPDGRRIVTASNDRTARVWDVVSGKK